MANDHAEMVARALRALELAHLQPIDIDVPGEEYVSGWFEEHQGDPVIRALIEYAGRKQVAEAWDELRKGG